jgi:hypothetical protein
MIIGSRQLFGIECHHEPLSNGSKQVFGRMCVFVGGNILGDIDEPACMLNVTQAHLSRIIFRLPQLDCEKFKNLSDRDAFDFLNRTLYLENERSNNEIQRDIERYSKFVFLTNGGESFDGTKSFIIVSGEHIRLLFIDLEGNFYASHVPKDTFLLVTNAFLTWMDGECK